MAEHRRPKKLIFAPGDIETMLSDSAPAAASLIAAATAATVAAADSGTSTPSSATETQLLSHPARAHQFITNPPLTISQMHRTNPLHQFNSWFRDARLSPSSAPETCTLATAEMPSGRVSARIVYLKELDERGWVVYSNWGSRQGKGKQVFGLEGPEEEIGSIPEPDSGCTSAGNKWGALTFSWATVERQVRVEGLLEPLSRQESELYWRTRERGSQIGAWASWQSKVLWETDSIGEPGEEVDGGPDEGGSSCAEIPRDIDETDVEDGRAVLEQRVKEMEARFAGVQEIPLPPFWGGMRLVPESVEFWQGRRSRLHDRFRYVRLAEKWRIQRLSP
ncbi:hypothetical protein ASPZODRAFT_21328 [Penicilliopsis zonata CBS 506.65]|uniref:pyridoxal 5'-phosphate synthase n=1 Tax=Penicilliopsis zonata CBS 506.65 TaxID=1073090 RepID=A0A1L9SUL3_9EURO|nr:hypothetical protein ASPZODRAFT_21328 [Penicilliopsis zonata CBS 506.65]OJJ50811.1 hypothetical protein ASPZODRAFT_21328 [Penicilliopsis zonata CBS 506.65]